MVFHPNLGVQLIASYPSAGPWPELWRTKNVKCLDATPFLLREIPNVSVWETHLQAILGQHSEAFLKRCMDIDRMKPRTGERLDMLGCNWACHVSPHLILQIS